MNFSISFPASTNKTLVHIGSGSASAFLDDGDYFLVADANIAEIYPNLLHNKTYILKGDESSKDLASAAKLIMWLQNSGCQRGDHIIALGGGSIGDLTGCIAMLYEHGLEWSYIPTTLISMVNASIGGKVSLNFNGIKNVVGNYYHPLNVVVDPNFLDTLPKYDFLSGLVEIIRYAFVADDSLLPYLLHPEDVLRLEDDTIYKILTSACKFKAGIVKADPSEEGIRRILTAGNILAHAIESVFNFRIAYGHALAIGLYYESIIGMELGYTKGEVVDELYKIFTLYGFELNFPAKKQVVSNINKRYHNQSRPLSTSFIHDIGYAKLVDVSIDQFIKNIKF